MNLFSKADSHDAREHVKQQMLSEIDQLREVDVMKTKLDDWSEHFSDKYSFDIIVLDESATYVEVNDVKVSPDSLGDRNSWFHDDRFGSSNVSATEIAFHVPFSGDEDLFHIRPSAFAFNPPRAAIQNGELVFRYNFGTPDPVAAKTSFAGDLANVRSYVNNLKNDFAAFNGELKNIALERLKKRFSKLQKDNEVATALGFPVKKRGDAPKTYIVPTVRRKIAARPQPAKGHAETPEPELALEDFEHILSVTSNMVSVIEQSPHVFIGMDEETLRSHFLIQLNGQYEGQATGETFNFEGKTDILVKENGKNVFVGECKFWKGAVAFSETIDQLLTYLSWRDTKSAILLFNRNKDLTNVLGQIPGIVRSHASYLRDWEGAKRETEFRFVVAHRDDPKRELFLVVQVYEVPT